MTHAVTGRIPTWGEHRLAESATRRGASSDAETSLLPRLQDVPVVAAGVILAALVAGYLGTILLTGAARPLLVPTAPFGLDVVFRINLVMITLIAYTAAAGLLEFRSAPGELGRLRALLDCDDATFASALEAFFPTRLQAAVAWAGGCLFAFAVAWTSRTRGDRLGAISTWDLHEHWNLALLVLLFSLLGLFALWGIRSARLYSVLSRRHARVRLLDAERLQLFGVRGLRLALIWFLGSGIALLLAVGAQDQAVVLGVIALTSALGVASLILPSLGIHQRLREVKAAELSRVRGEIESRVEALRAGDGEGTGELPALLAWEARVAEVPVWPLGGAVMIRFGLLVLIPVGSWLGGAMVERLVDATLG
jgi:hypothetical protein